MSVGLGDPALRAWVDAGRVVATHGDPSAGPTLVVVGGLHGNEPGGLDAGRRVVERLVAEQREIQGLLVVVAGNRPALAAHRRFLDRDLNRRWHAEQIASVAATDTRDRAREDREQLDLVRLFDHLLQTYGHGARLVDLHTTSGSAPPFSVIVDSADNRALALSLGYPVITGFAHYVDGPILVWWHERGLPAVGVEGGRHDDVEAIDHLSATVWQAMSGLGWVAADSWRAASAPAGSPPVLRIIYRHGVVPGARFRMAPGFESFMPVKRGQLLATDATGAIRALEDAQIFLPLYQDQGADGFFLIAPAQGWGPTTRS